MRPLSYGGNLFLPYLPALYLEARRSHSWIGDEGDLRAGEPPATLVRRSELPATPPPVDLSACQIAVLSLAACRRHQLSIRIRSYTVV